MFNRWIRWILPLMVLVVIGLYFVLSTMLATHAAGPGFPAIHVTVPHYYSPDFFWHH
jgi:hypothetical protein